MIEIRQRADQGSRTSRGVAWIAETVVDGQCCVARSRSGAPLVLARTLIGRGVADQPVTVRQDGVAGEMVWPSLAKMAGLTIAESAKVQVSLRKWSEYNHVSAKTGGEADSGDNDP